MQSRALILAVFALGGAVRAEAQVSLWTADGVAVCSPECTPDIPFIISDGSGGAYIAWRESRDYPVSGEDVYLQRLTPQGDIYAGWPPGGVPVCTDVRTQVLTGLAPDAHGGALVVWQDFREGGSLGYSADIYCQRILPDGSVAPGWISGGTPGCRWPGYQGNPSSIVPDGTGGTYVVWLDERDRPANPDQGADVYAQHLTADGQIAPGWSEGGLPLSTALGSQLGGDRHALTPDGTGGAVAVWEDCRSTPCLSYGQRLLPDGSLAPGWPVNGLQLSAQYTIPHVAADPAGGFYVASTTADEFGGTQDIFLRRFGLDGVPAPGWPQEGLKLCCDEAGSGGRVHPEPDGFGGVLVVRSGSFGSGLDIWAFRAQADATLAPGWPFGGVRVNDPSVPTNSDDDFVGDGAGGAFVTWMAEPGEGRPVWLQHLSPLGVPVEGWPAYGVRVASTRNEFTPKAAPDGSMGVIVVWQERGGVGSRRGLFAQRFVDDDATQTRPSLVSAEAEEGLVTLVWYAEGAGGLAATVERRTQLSDWSFIGEPAADGPDGLRYEDRSVLAGEHYAYRLGYRQGDAILYTTETWVEVPNTLRLALHGFTPNPARHAASVAFDLPGEGQASLEVIDIRGRIAARLDVGHLGTGRHVIPIEAAADLAPGVYILRLTRGEERLLARGAIIP